MDKHARMDHLNTLLIANQDLLAKINEQRAKLATHHPSRERDREIMHLGKTGTRMQKQQRSLERAIRNESKRSS